MNAIQRLFHKHSRKKNPKTGITGIAVGTVDVIKGNNDVMIALKKFIIGLIATIVGALAVWLAAPELSFRALLTLVVIPVLLFLQNWLSHWNA